METHKKTVEYKGNIIKGKAVKTRSSLRCNITVKVKEKIDLPIIPTFTLTRFTIRRRNVDTLRTDLEGRLSNTINDAKSEIETSEV